MPGGGFSAGFASGFHVAGNLEERLERSRQIAQNHVWQQEARQARESIMERLRQAREPVIRLRMAYENLMAEGDGLPEEEQERWLRRIENASQLAVTAEMDAVAGLTLDYSGNPHVEKMAADHVQNIVQRVNQATQYLSTVQSSISQEQTAETYARGETAMTPEQRMVVEQQVRSEWANLSDDQQRQWIQRQQEAGRIPPDADLSDPSAPIFGDAYVADRIRQYQQGEMGGFPDASAFPTRGRVEPGTRVGGSGYRAGAAVRRGAKAAGSAVGDAAGGVPRFFEGLVGAAPGSATAGLEPGMFGQIRAEMGADAEKVARDAVEFFRDLMGMDENASPEEVAAEAENADPDLIEQGKALFRKYVLGEEHIRGRPPKKRGGERR